jgi:hypothetical protein
MSQRTTKSINQTIAGLATVAITSGVFVASALSSPPTANATCVSAFGIGNSANCFSNFSSIAIAIGTGASAYADGLFGAAISFGNGALAATGLGPTDRSGVLDLALAIGDNAGAGTGGSLALSVVALASGYNGAQAGSSSSLGSVAIVLGGSGPLNQPNVAATNGVGNIAVNFFGTQNVVAAFRTGSSAFSVGGSNNGVEADGPLAVAGSILQANALVIKSGPGFNINGLKLGSAAAPPQKAGSALKTKTVRTAATGGSKNRATGSAAAPKHFSKK